MTANSALAEDCRVYFDVLRTGFERAAAAAGGSIDRCFRLARFTLRLRFAGPALQDRIVPAIAHLEVPPSETADLTIGLFDRASTGTRLPLLVDSLVRLILLRWWEHLDTRREIREYHGERIRTVFHLGPNILSALDLDTDSALYWVDDGDTIPYYEQGYPLSTLLNWWLTERRHCFVHAAAVGRPDGGVLIAGKGGSGKSTSALSCVGSPLRIVSDDYAIVDTRDLSTAFSIYSTAKLKGPEDVARFPHLAGLVSNPDRLDAEKALVFLHEHVPDAVLTEMPVRAILVPSITGQAKTRIEPSSAAAALTALAPSTLLQLSGNGAPVLHALSGLVRRTPVFALGLGTDLDTIPRVIEKLLDDLG